MILHLDDGFFHSDLRFALSIGINPLTGFTGVMSNIAGFLLISNNNRRFFQKNEIPRPCGQGIGN
jgi:hypothetical protein